MDVLERRHRNGWWIGALFLGFFVAAARPVRAQLPSTEEERLQILTEPELMKKKGEKDKNRAPFEFFRSQVAPFDILPYVKPNHWSTLWFEMRANDDDYEGYLTADPVMLLDTPQEVTYRREARLLKEQRARLFLQMMIPAQSGVVPKETGVELIRERALRADSSWPATLTTLPPHQMLVVILSKDSTSKFAAWNKMAAVIPSIAERDATDLEKLRYYRLVLPMEPDKVALSPHPLTWTTISHVIWDNYAPDLLSGSAQRALVDWLHWGGQLIVCGGAGQPFSLYHESFLGPYLPADASGETAALTMDDLAPLSQSYPPPLSQPAADDQSQPVPLTTNEARRRFKRRYEAAVPIRPAAGHPFYLSVLRPRPGASTIALGEASPRILAVERRVGRGRITMLAVNPNEEALLAWPGLDTLVRRVILRRPEEPVVNEGSYDGFSARSPERGRLLAADLSWYRITSRDTGSGLATAKLPVHVADPSRTNSAPETAEDQFGMLPGIADWRDSSKLPRMCRDVLEEASGITIPSSKFVFWVIFAYLIAVVPLNWLICRFVFNRREWAWVVVPVVALCFAVGVERLAARDIGYDTASDEVDILELHGGYPRGHLSRVVSLYTTGRSQFKISYPNEPTALALPMDSGRSIRGEDIARSIFESYPVPTLADFRVQPRSMSMFRAEQMVGLSGAIQIEGEGNTRRLVNGSELELRDAVLIDLSGEKAGRERALGTIAAGGSVELGQATGEGPAGDVKVEPGPDPNSVLKELRTAWESREENKGELRLVAWVAGTPGGQVIEPPVDRRRGVTAVTVHLSAGNPPSPDAKRYNLLAEGGPADDSAITADVTEGSVRLSGRGPGTARTKMTRRPARPVSKARTPATSAP
jgi:hypothetical protein